jgi:hypothetical protein
MTKLLQKNIAAHISLSDDEIYVLEQGYASFGNIVKQINALVY